MGDCAVTVDGCGQQWNGRCDDHINSRREEEKSCEGEQG